MFEFTTDGFGHWDCARCGVEFEKNELYCDDCMAQVVEEWKAEHAERDENDWNEEGDK
jgi:predicted amidophosphoribosyltransferase